jgi:hypothetical protein
MTAMTETLPDKLDEAVEAELLKGIRVPRPAILAPGTIIVRFANSGSWADRYSASPWWIQEIDFRQIQATQQHSLDVHGNDPQRALTLGFIGRQALAVKQRWFESGPHNLMDVVVRAEVLRELPCFVGRGHSQYETAPNGFRLTWTGWSSVEQIFVPELVKHRGPYIGPWMDREPVVRVIQSIPITSQQLF